MDALLIETGQCKAKAKGSGERCKNKATEGYEVCRIHGGATGTGRPPIHGRYSVTRRAGLQEKYQHFFDDPSVGDLRPELALLRATLQGYLDGFDIYGPIEEIHIGRVLEMVDAIGRMVERIAKILSTTALTQAELQLLQVTLIDAIEEFIPEPERRRAFVSRISGALGQRLGASVGTLSTHAE